MLVFLKVRTEQWFFAVIFLPEEVAAENKKDFLHCKKGIYNTGLRYSSVRQLKRDSLKLYAGEMSVVCHKFLFFLCMSQLFSLTINGCLSVALRKMEICGSSSSQLEKEPSLAVLPGFHNSVCMWL